MASYFPRLLLGRWQESTTILLPLGVVGNAGYAVLILTAQTERLLPPVISIDVPYRLQILGLVGKFGAVAIWVSGFVWASFAVLYHCRHKPVFNLRWWCAVYSIGCYAQFTLAMGEIFSSIGIRVLGTIFVAGSIMLWLGVTLFTVMWASWGDKYAIFDVPGMDAPPSPANDHDRAPKRDWRHAVDVACIALDSMRR